jgi:hypothetical protein
VNFVAALEEAIGKRKHVVVLKPLMSKDNPTQFRKKYSDWSIIRATDETFGIGNPPYNLNPDEWRVAYDALQARRETPEYKAAFARIRDEMLKDLPPMRDRDRVIEADYVAPLDDGTMVLGINPGTYTSETRGFHGDQLRKKRRQTDVYASIVWNPQARDGDGAYVTTRKFKKILTVNTDNIKTIDGKPVIGGSRTMDKGIQHLDLGESIEAQNPQPQQPKAYRIIMRAQSEADRAAEAEEKGYVDSLPARDATVIDADHIAPLTDEIYLVGISVGPGRPHISRLRHPIPHNDFWHPMQHRPSNPNAPCEIDDEGFHNHPEGDPHHTDYYTVPKFQQILTMHIKNIASINGKPVMYVGNTDPGAAQLGQFDEWSINNITKFLED